MQTTLGTTTWMTGKDEAQSIFVLISASEALHLLVYTASHTYLHYSPAVRKKHAEMLHLEEVDIPAFPVVVGY